MKIKFTDNNDLRRLPQKSTSGSAAYDLYLPDDVLIKEGRNVVKMGFCMELDKGLAAEIHPRSGYAAKGMEGQEVIPKQVGEVGKNGFYGVASQGRYASLETTRFNADVIYGLIDEDFRDEVGVIINNNDSMFMIKRGTRIAQMLITPTVDVSFELTNELSETDRKGGFGSTNENN